MCVCVCHKKQQNKQEDNGVSKKVKMSETRATLHIISQDGIILFNCAYPTPLNRG